MIKGFDGKTEDECLVASAKPTLLSSYYTILVIYFPFNFTSQSEDSSDLDTGERERLTTLLANIQTMTTCLVEWIDDPAIHTLGDIKNTTMNHKYETAGKHISDFFQQVKQDQESISQSMASISSTMDTLNKTLSLTIVVSENRELIKEFFSVWAPQFKDVTVHLNNSNLEKIQEYKDTTEAFHTRIQSALTKIDKLQPTWLNRTTFTLDEVNLFISHTPEQISSLDSQVVQQMTACIQEQNLWTQREQLSEQFEMLCKVVV